MLGMLIVLCSDFWNGEESGGVGADELVGVGYCLEEVCITSCCGCWSLEDHTVLSTVPLASLSSPL